MSSLLKLLKKQAKKSDGDGEANDVAVVISPTEAVSHDLAPPSQQPQQNQQVQANVSEKAANTSGNGTLPAPTVSTSSDKEDAVDSVVTLDPSTKPRTAQQQLPDEQPEESSGVKAQQQSNGDGSNDKNRPAGTTEQPTVNQSNDGHTSTASTASTAATTVADTVVAAPVGTAETSTPSKVRPADSVSTSSPPGSPENATSATRSPSDTNTPTANSTTSPVPATRAADTGEESKANDGSSEEGEAEKVDDGAEDKGDEGNEGDDDDIGDGSDDDDKGDGSDDDDDNNDDDGDDDDDSDDDSDDDGDDDSDDDANDDDGEGEEGDVFKQHPSNPPSPEESKTLLEQLENTSSTADDNGGTESHRVTKTKEATAPTVVYKPKTSTAAPPPPVKQEANGTQKKAEAEAPPNKTGTATATVLKRSTTGVVKTTGTTASAAVLPKKTATTATPSTVQKSASSVKSAKATKPAPVLYKRTATTATASTLAKKPGTTASKATVAKSAPISTKKTATTIKPPSMVKKLTSSSATKAVAQVGESKDKAAKSKTSASKAVVASSSQTASATTAAPPPPQNTPSQLASQLTAQISSLEQRIAQAQQHIVDHLDSMDAIQSEKTKRVLLLVTKDVKAIRSASTAAQRQTQQLAKTVSAIETTTGLIDSAIRNDLQKQVVDAVKKSVKDHLVPNVVRLVVSGLRPVLTSLVKESTDAVKKEVTAAIEAKLIESMKIFDGVMKEMAKQTGEKFNLGFDDLTDQVCHRLGDHLGPQSTMGKVVQGMSAKVKEVKEEMTAVKDTMKGFDGKIGAASQSLDQQQKLQSSLFAHLQTIKARVEALKGGVPQLQQSSHGQSAPVSHPSQAPADSTSAPQQPIVATESFENFLTLWKAGKFSEAIEEGLAPKDAVLKIRVAEFLIAQDLAWVSSASTPALEKVLYLVVKSLQAGRGPVSQRSSLDRIGVQVVQQMQSLGHQPSAPRLKFFTAEVAKLDPSLTLPGIWPFY